MKKLICILAGAALLGACEQKTEVAVPAATPGPETKPDLSAMGAKQRKTKVDPATLSTVAPEQADSAAVAAATPAP